MKKINLFIVICFTFFQFSCVKNEPIGNTISNQKNSCGGISPEAAILIGKGFFFEDSSVENFEVSVKEDGEFLEVHFASKCKECNDGKPYLIIRKINGEVIRSFRYGKPMSLKNTNGN